MTPLLRSRIAAPQASSIWRCCCHPGPISGSGRARPPKKRISLQGASDHGVSEAIYLGDPEGNGIEIYTDRPSSDWTLNNGAIAMKTDHLDIDNLLLSATPARWEAPTGR